MGLYKFCIVFLGEVYSFAACTGALMIFSVDVNSETKGSAVYNNKMLCTVTKCVLFNIEVKKIYFTSSRKRKKML